MKRDCEMARDLMPLCVDGVASEGSQEFVAAHAASCRECAEVVSYTHLLIDLLERILSGQAG